MHYPWMNFNFHYYLLSFTFKLPSSFWRKKEGVQRDFSGNNNSRNEGGGKKEREISASPSQRVWRKKIRTIPLNSSWNIIILSSVNFLFYFSSEQTIVFFFFFYEQSCTNNYYIISTFCLIVTSLKFLRVDIVIGVSITVWRAQIYHLSLQKEVNFARY